MNLRKLQRWFTNSIWVKGQRRYVLVTVFFIIWMLFVDKYRVSTTISLNNSIDKLEESKSYYEQGIIKAQKEKRDLELNKEKYAREKYLMHKENEDVFIIENE